MADVGVEGHKRRHSKSAHRVKFNLITQSKLAGPFTDHFPHYAGGVARSEPGGFVISQEFGHHAHEFFYFQPRKDDVWMLTFPKCGMHGQFGILLFFKRNASGNFVVLFYQN
jgi:hypothetical protein